MLSCEVVRDGVGFAQLEPEWDELHLECQHPTTTNSFSWCRTWWETMGLGTASRGRGRLYIITLRNDDGKLVAVFPMFEEKGWHPFRINMLRSFGVSAGFMPHSLTEEPTCMILPGCLDEAIAGLKSHLAENAKRWDAISFRLRTPNAAEISEQIKAMDAPWRVRITNITLGSDTAPLAADWDSVRKSLSRSMRDNLPYYPKLLTRHGHEWSLELVRDPSVVKELIPTLLALHKARSESKTLYPHDNYFPGEDERSFVTRILMESSERGEAFFGVLKVSGEIVAIQAFLEFRGSTVVWYSGFKEEFSAFSPLFIIQTEVFKTGLDRNIRTINFLRTHRTWTSRWGARSDEDTLDVMLARNAPLSLLRFGAHCGQWQLSDKLKEIAHAKARKSIEGKREAKKPAA
jgi:CelD/BcsL family acetyltransferase involved in cellulose biosynthesis